MPARPRPHALPSRRSSISQTSSLSPVVNLGERLDQNSIDLSRRGDDGGDNSTRSSTGHQRNDPAREDVEQNPKLREKNLQTIYANCLDLFQTKKISANNAFSCKLLDYLDQVIRMENFDISNMQLVGRTLEVGTKIYVCRVDFTYKMVMDLAKRIGAKGKAMERLREIAEQQRQEGEEEEEEEEIELGDNELDENGEPLYPQELKVREKKRRQGKCVAQKDKIRLTFPEKLEQFADRQRRIQTVLTKFKETRVPVSHAEFEIRGLVEDVSGDTDSNKELGALHKFPRALFRPENGASLKFLEFIWLPSGVPFDREIYDPWGRLKHAESTEVSRRGAEAPAPAAVGMEDGSEYQFNVNVENDYGCVMGENENIVGVEGFGEFGCSDDENEREENLKDLGQVENMSQLEHFYQVLRTAGDSRATFGWAGPSYFKNRGPGSRGRILGNTERRGRTKKDVKPVSFKAIDWKDEENKYHAVGPQRIELDDKILARWMKSKVALPFLGTVTDDVDVEFDEEAFMEAFEKPYDGNEKEYVDKSLRYFVDRNRNILQIFDKSGKRTASRGFNPNRNSNDDVNEGFDVIRSHFEDEDDYCAPSPPEPLDSGRHDVSKVVFSKDPDSFINFFPISSQDTKDDYDEFMGTTADSDGIKFAKQPKPINMRLLKRSILAILKEKLQLDDDFKSTQDEDTTMDFLTLLANVFHRVDERTAKFLSSSLLFVALLHVVSEKSLFLESLPGEIENFIIIARRKGWVHADHIPMPPHVDMSDFDTCGSPSPPKPSSKDDEADGI